MKDTKGASNLSGKRATNLGHLSQQTNDHRPRDGTSPPKKKVAPAPAKESGANLTKGFPTYTLPGNVQVQWESEGYRLLTLFWRSGQTRHLQAFVCHLVGMRGRMLERGAA